jgi:hypothetical protein
LTGGGHVTGVSRPKPGHFTRAGHVTGVSRRPAHQPATSRRVRREAAGKRRQGWTSASFRPGRCPVKPGQPWLLPGHRSRRMGDTTFRRDFATLVRELLEESQRESNPIGRPIREHLGMSDDDLAVHAEELSDFELPNLQLALDAALARPGWQGRVLGIAGQGRHFSGLGLGDLMVNEHLSIGPPEYVNAPLGPGRSLPCLVWAVLLVTAPEGRLAVFVQRGEAHADAGEPCRAGGRAGSRARIAIPCRCA